MPDQRWATPEEVEAVRQAQAEEYGQYVASGPIDIDGARAFNKGDAVPREHVERGVVRTDQVDRVATKTEAAKAAKEG